MAIQPSATESYSGCFYAEMEPACQVPRAFFLARKYPPLEDRLEVRKERERGGAASEGVARTHDLFTFADVRCLAQADRDKLPVTCPH